MNYYLITDETTCGDHVYHSQTVVYSATTWDAYSWEKYFLNWQSSVTEVDEDGELWSGNRIVQVIGIKELTEDQFKVLDELLGSFDMEVILKYGKENWDVNGDVYSWENDHNSRGADFDVLDRRDGIPNE